LKDIFNNQAASPDGSADFDGHGNSFDSRLLPQGPFINDGVQVSTHAFAFLDSSMLNRCSLSLISTILLPLGERATTTSLPMDKL
jgi:hypothetical protein